MLVYNLKCKEIETTKTLHFMIFQTPQVNAIVKYQFRTPGKINDKNIVTIFYVIRPCR